MGRNVCNETIARNIRFLLSETDMSDHELARASNISKSTLSRILNREFKRDVDPSYISAISGALHVDMDVLTESNVELKARLDFLEKTVSESVVFSKEVVNEIEQLVTITSCRGAQERSRSLRICGMIEYQRGRFSLALEYYEKAYSISVRGEVEDLQLQLAKNKSEAMLMLGWFESVEKTILDVMARIVDSEMRARMYFILASSYYKQENFQVAREHFELALHLIPDQTNTKILKTRCCQSLGGTFQRLEEFNKARSYSETAYQLAKQCGDPMSELYALQVIGEIEAVQGNISLAICRFSEALEIAQGISRNYEIISLKFSISYLRNSLVEIESILDEAVDVEIPPRDLADMCTKVARMAFGESKYEVAQKFYERALKAMNK